MEIGGRMDRYEEIKNKDEWVIDDEKWCIKEIKRLREQKEWLIELVKKAYSLEEW